MSSLPLAPGTRSAAPTPSHSSTAFCLWSANSGHASMGTPCTRLSSVEFQPQCVRKPPVDWCASTLGCGAHDGTTRPTSLVRSRNPWGR
uniref:Uncharacterized protein n=1 Tax=Zea mays TaxID=4577 RepID=C4J1X7_MAIZE|nr:unknown [Zea mays]